MKSRKLAIYLRLGLYEQLASMEGSWTEKLGKYLHQYQALAAKGRGIKNVRGAIAAFNKERHKDKTTKRVQGYFPEGDFLWEYIENFSELYTDANVSLGVNLMLAHALLEEGRIACT